MKLLDRRFLNISLTVQAIANQPYADPSAGFQYIVGLSPAGAFAGASTNSIAQYDGTKWTFFTPKVGELEVLNLDTGEVLSFNGTNWTAIFSLYEPVAPVLAIVPTGSTLPSSAAAGDSLLNTSDAKLYTATAADTWDSGTLTANGSRYASSADHKIYQSNGSVLSATNIIDGDMFLNREDGAVYAYDSTASAFVKVNGYPVEFVTEAHTLTAAEVIAKSFTLTNSVASGKENNTLLFVSGIAQSASTDFTVSDNSVSWNNKGLDSIGLIEGDTFIVHYVRA